MKWLHNLLKGVSLTGALFVFQACYGMPRPAIMDEQGEAPMSFSLVSHETGEPLEGIRIVAKDWGHELGTTGTDGRCRVGIPYFRNEAGPFLTFEDPQGYYAAKDTSLADLRDREIVVKMDKAGSIASSSAQ